MDKKSSAAARLTGMNKKRELVRMDNAGKKEKCSICFDAKSVGLECDKRHFVCADCFSPFVESLCDDVGKLKDAAFEVACPVPECTSLHWNSYHVREMLKGETLEKYIDTLIRLCKQHGNIPADAAGGDLQNKKAATRQRILDCLSIGCPRCEGVLDPNPDGCCAMKCPGCGTHFCFLCLSTSDNSASCHTHVRVCPKSPEPGNLFVTKDGVMRAHTVLRVAAVRAIVVKYFLDRHKKKDCTTEQLSSCTDVVELLVSCKQNLEALNITANDLLPNFVAPDAHNVAAPEAEGLLCFTVSTTAAVFVSIVFVCAYFAYTVIKSVSSITSEPSSTSMAPVEAMTTAVLSDYRTYEAMLILLASMNFVFQGRSTKSLMCLLLATVATYLLEFMRTVVFKVGSSILTVVIYLLEFLCAVVFKVGVISLRVMGAIARHVLSNCVTPDSLPVLLATVNFLFRGRTTKSLMGVLLAVMFYYRHIVQSVMRSDDNSYAG
jgi:hypothetical protein